MVEGAPTSYVRTILEHIFNTTSTLNTESPRAESEGVLRDEGVE